MWRFVSDEALKNSALRMRCHNINKRLMHLLRFKCRSRGAMRLWTEHCLRGACSQTIAHLGLKPSPALADAGFRR
jgi:hypothetical protein